MEYWIWLSQLKGLGPVIQKRLLDKFGNPKDVYDLDKSALLEIEGIGVSIADGMISARSLDDSMKILDNLNKIGGKLLTIYDDLYPQYAALEMYSPIVLYYRGEIKVTFME